jgi:hypothetical protein
MERTTQKRNWGGKREMNNLFTEGVRSFATSLNSIFLLALLTLVLLIIIKLLPYTLSNKQKKHLRRLNNERI